MLKHTHAVAHYAGLKFFGGPTVLYLKYKFYHFPTLEQFEIAQKKTLFTGRINILLTSNMNIPSHFILYLLFV